MNQSKKCFFHLTWPQCSDFQEFWSDNKWQIFFSLRNNVNLITIPWHCSFDGTHGYTIPVQSCLRDLIPISHTYQRASFYWEAHTKQTNAGSKPWIHKELFREKGLGSYWQMSLNSQKNLQFYLFFQWKYIRCFLLFIIVQKKIPDIQYGSYQTRPPTWYVGCHNGMFLISSFWRSLFHSGAFWYISL